MSQGRTAAGTARRAGSGRARLVQAWQALPHESRLAAYASGALFLTLFLPWYQVTLIATAKASRLQSASATITGWGAFSFVEAAVLLVAAGVVTLLFQRAEGRAFHLPGGDGGVITAAGLWTCLLVVWRIFDKQGATTNGPSATTSGVEWGIFIALAAAAFLAYSGGRVRAAHRPEPPLPGESSPPADSSSAATVVRPPRRQRETAPPPRRRAGIPTPVPAEPMSPPPAAPMAPVAAAPSPDRPRRRVGAAELFERVVPDDPPSMPFGRAKPAKIEIRRTRAAAADEQLTMPLGQDETVALGENETVVLGGDPTLAIRGGDPTLAIRGGDPTLAIRGGDPTLAMGGEDPTLALRRDEATLPLGEDPTRPLERRPKRH